MSNIDIRRFVDVNVVHHATSSISATRDTTVMFVSRATYGDLVTANIPEERVIMAYTEVVVINKEEAYEVLDFADDDDSIEKAFIDMYYANGGQKLCIYALSVGAGETEPSASTIIEAVESLPDEFIITSMPSSNETFKSAFDLLANKTIHPEFYGIKVKLAVGNFDEGVIVRNPYTIAVIANDELSSLICAYISRLTLNTASSVKQIEFTPVKVDKEEVVNNDNTVKRCLENNLNCVIHLAGADRIVGGNTLAGDDLVNEFALIVLQQTVTEKVLNTLVQKLRGEAGVAAIQTAIAQELDRYVKNGLLTTDKIWTDEDLTVEYNNQTYTIIEKNTALLNGYQIKVLPYRALSEDDKQLHAAPPIYLVLATSYGIRKVTIKGEVI